MIYRPSFRTGRALSLALLAILLPAATASANDVLVQDPRTSLGLTDSERAQFLSEMRRMLASVQGIVAGIAEHDREKIAAAARYSGNRMARATPDAVRARLPQSFKDLGGPTHLLFEELAIRAESDDMETLTAFTGELMQQCLACHAQFRAD
jgi:cytochrome c556